MAANQGGGDKGPPAIQKPLPYYRPDTVACSTTSLGLKHRGERVECHVTVWFSYAVIFAIFTVRAIGHATKHVSTAERYSSTGIQATKLQFIYYPLNLQSTI